MLDGSDEWWQNLVIVKLEVILHGHPARHDPQLTLSCAGDETKFSKRDTPDLLTLHVLDPFDQDRWSDLSGGRGGEEKVDTLRIVG